jgi:hypothetical protein
MSTQLTETYNLVYDVSCMYEFILRMRSIRSISRYMRLHTIARNMQIFMVFYNVYFFCFLEDCNLKCNKPELKNKAPQIQKNLYNTTNGKFYITIGRLMAHAFAEMVSLRLLLMIAKIPNFCSSRAMRLHQDYNWCNIFIPLSVGLCLCCSRDSDFLTLL